MSRLSSKLFKNESNSGISLYQLYEVILKYSRSDIYSMKSSTTDDFKVF